MVMFAEFLTKNEFKKEYIESFATRFTISNLEMEEKGDLTSPDKQILLYCNKKAFLNALKECNDPSKLSPYDILAIGNDVNNKIYSGFRKTDVDVVKAQHFVPAIPKEILPRLYSLCDNYRNVWTDLDVYEKEARLHIELVRMQPFEDGNKRTARILTAYNLCYQNKAPILITYNNLEEYFKYIDTYDIANLAKMFKESSNKEFEAMLNLYSSINGNSLTDDFDDTLPNKSIKKYVLRRKKSTD
jgi:Fic family protein